MEYVQFGQGRGIVCVDCGEALPVGARYELKGEPEQVICVQCCADGGMSIGDPDEACPNCGAVDWAEPYTRGGEPTVMCNECGLNLDLNDPCEMLPKLNLPGEDMEMLRRLEAQYDYLHEPDEADDDDRDYFDEEEEDEEADDFPMALEYDEE